MKMLTPIEILQNTKRIRINSDVGYLLLDADIIYALTGTGLSWEEAEEFFNENYKSVKV